MRVFIFFMVFLGGLPLVFAGLSPSEERAETPKLDQKCRYSDIYSASQKTFLILNLVEKLVPHQKDLGASAREVLEAAAQEVVTECESGHKIEFSKVEYKNNKLIFEYGAGLHSVEWLLKKSSVYLVYKKLYGSYKNEPLMVINSKNERREFTRITARYGPENSNKRYTFFYPGTEKKFTKKIELESKSHKTIRSLEAIYGKVGARKFKPQIKVGVIGTGLDYNHPGVAKFLAYRPEMEEGLKKIESLELRLRKDSALESEEYEALSLEYQKLKPSVGFPRWMDQALGTKTPYDTIIVDKKKSRRTSSEHETRVTSRILRTQGAVEVHFARRSMGSLDYLNVSQVVDKFAAQGVRLINLSFGSQCGKFLKEEEMWAEAFKRYSDIVFVVSAGNSGLNSEATPFCPATFSKDFKNVISVTALGENGQLAVYYDTPVNFGSDIDLAIRSDNLEVLIPYRKKMRWENNANGATSLAAAEVSRILSEVVLEGLDWDAQTVKEKLVQTSTHSAVLKGVNKYSSEVNEWAFREKLRNNSKRLVYSL